MASQKPETMFDIGDLFDMMNNSFTNAAVKLREEFKKKAWDDSPFVYHMPKMHLSMRLTLSHSDGTVKGFFRKSRRDREEEVSSIIEVDVVAVPRERKPADQDSST